MNKIKNKLNNQAVIGTFLVIGSPQLAKIISSAGYDFVLVDAEHGLMGLETSAAMFDAISKYCTPFVRVAGSDQATVKRALDAGAMGIMIPMLSSVEEVRNAIAYSKYPPEGVRGKGPGAASNFAINLAEYSNRANEYITIVIQIENTQALQNIDEILQVPGVDVAFVGPTDLSMSMGVPDKSHPQVEAGIEKMLAACQKHGVTPGIFCFEEKEAAQRIKQGFKFIAVGLDSFFAYSASASALNYVKTNT